MSIKRNKTARRRVSAQKPKTEAPTRPVQEILLELAYRLHATKPLPVVRREIGSVA
jgi:hypothetical protein